jgi:hypothetical protein
MASKTSSKLVIEGERDKDDTNKAMLDNILDKKLVKFDNKHQMSMFFIAYKSIDALYKELCDSVHYTIPDEIIKRVVLETVPSIIKEYNSNLRKRCRSNTKPGSDDTICLGRKIDGTQCTRKKYNNNDFCKNHMKKLPNGRVDIPLETNTAATAATAATTTPATAKEDSNVNINKPVPEPIANANLADEVSSVEKVATDSKPIKVSKRGRKSKIQFDPRQYDNEYITLWEDIVEGEKVLIDNANNIYTFDLEHPVYIGKKDITVKLNIRKFMDSLAKKA